MLIFYQYFFILLTTYIFSIITLTNNLLYLDYNQFIYNKLLIIHIGYYLNLIITICINILIKCNLQIYQILTIFSTGLFWGIASWGIIIIIDKKTFFLLFICLIFFLEKKLNIMRTATKNLYTYTVFIFFNLLLLVLSMYIYIYVHTTIHQIDKSIHIFFFFFDPYITINLFFFLTILILLSTIDSVYLKK